MILSFLKGLLMLFPIYLAMGIVGNLVGALLLLLFTVIKKTSVDLYLFISTLICSIVGMIFFAILGMFYAAFALFISSYISLWITIAVTVVFLVVLTKYNYRAILKLHYKNKSIKIYDFDDTANYYKNIQLVNESILLGWITLFPSFILFLIFPTLSDKLSFGLSSYLITLIK